MKTLSEIQSEVDRWSLLNFGSQQSMSTGANLYSLAPLLGIVEEVGEYETASIAGDEPGMRDAIGDILIYLCDFASREYACKLLLFDGKPTTFQTLTTTVGFLCHCVLKRHQGIRGMDNENFYNANRDSAINQLMLVISGICNNVLNDSVIDILNETWESVQKRDWKKNPGGEPSAVDDMDPRAASEPMSQYTYLPTRST